MKPAPFKYVAASSLDHALSLKAEYGDEARFLAGGQSLIPAMNFRLARPAVLFDINGLGELAGGAQRHPRSPSGGLDQDGAARAAGLPLDRLLGLDAGYANLAELAQVAGQ